MTAARRLDAHREDEATSCVLLQEMSRSKETSSDEKNTCDFGRLSLCLLIRQTLPGAKQASGTTRFSPKSTMSQRLLRRVPCTARNRSAIPSFQLPPHTSRDASRTLAGTRQTPKEFHDRGERHLLTVSPPEELRPAPSGSEGQPLCLCVSTCQSVDDGNSKKLIVRNTERTLFSSMETGIPLMRRHAVRPAGRPAEVGRLDSLRRAAELPAGILGDRVKQQDRGRR